MYRPTSEEELKRMAEAVAASIRKSIQDATPVFLAGMQQMKFAAENLKKSLEIFGRQLSESIEKWGEDDDGDKAGAKK